MRVRKSNRPVILTNLRWLAKDEVEYQKPFGKELSHVTTIENSISAQVIFPKLDKVESKIGWKKYGGFLFAILAALCFSLTSLASKLLARRKYHTFSIALWKYQGMTIVGPFLLIYYRFWKKQPIFESVWPLTKKGSFKTILLLVARGTAGFGSVLVLVQSLRYLTLADSTVISFSTPIAVSLFARVFLGEACGVVSILTALVTLGGVVVLTRPPILTGGEAFDNNILIGTSFAFACMLFITTVFIIVRSLREVHFSLLVVFYAYVATVESIILLFFVELAEIPQSQEDWIVAGANALFSLLGQFCIILALKYEQAGFSESFQKAFNKINFETEIISEGFVERLKGHAPLLRPVSLVRTLDIVFSFVWQFLFLSVVPDIFSLVGAVIIMFGISVTAFRKWVSTLPETDKSRDRFWFILK